jgi:hypothetical protein
MRSYLESISSLPQKILPSPLTRLVIGKRPKENDCHPEVPRQEHWLGHLLYIGNYVYCEQTDGEAGYLLFGGMLQGDTFHAIPLLNWLVGQRQRSKIIWWSGTYERQVVEFFKNFYPIEARYFHDGVPWEIEDRDKFINAHLPKLLRFLRHNSWKPVHFDANANKIFNLRNAERLQAEPQGTIVIHPSSRHSWKNIPAIAAVDWRQFGLPVVTLGAPGEYLIPGSLDFRGRPLLEVAQVLASARLFVGIHSAMSCLALYLNRTALVCAPTSDPAYARFSELNPQIKDLVQPTPLELGNAVSLALKQSESWRALASEAGGGCQV